MGVKATAVSQNVKSSPCENLSCWDHQDGRGWTRLDPLTSLIQNVLKHLTR